MPRYKWTRSDPFKDYANNRVVAEGEVVEISEDIAEPAYGFVEADEPDANPGDDAGEAGGSDADDAEDTAESGAEDTPDLEALADEHWRTTVSAIEDGEVDGHLDELAAIDGRESVQEAIAERQE